MLRTFVTGFLALVLLLTPLGGRADEEDPNILNWATIGDPGPQPPVDLAALEAYAPNVARPRAAIDGRIYARYKNGTEVTCANHSMDVLVLPVTAYTLWLVKSYALYARSEKWGAGRIWDRPGVPSILGKQPPTVIRATRCGAPFTDGYFRINGLPTGKYMLISGIFTAKSQGEEEDFNYEPGVVGVWTSRMLPGGDILEMYILYSSVEIPKGGNLIYHVPPFEVLAHYHTFD